MPTFDVEDPHTGAKYSLEGDSPPTEQELEHLFSNVSVGNQPRLPGENDLGGIFKMVPSGPHSVAPSLPNRMVPVPKGDGMSGALFNSVYPISANDYPRMVANPTTWEEGLYNAIIPNLEVGATSPFGLAVGPLASESIVGRPIASTMKMILAGLGAKTAGESLGALSGTPNPNPGQVAQGVGGAVMGGAMMLPFGAKVYDALKSPVYTPEVLPMKPGVVPLTPRLLEEPPIDVESSLVRGNQLPPATRFQQDPTGALMDVQQLSTAEQNAMYGALERQKARDASQIAARQTRPKQGEVPIINAPEQPQATVEDQIVAMMKPLILRAFQASGQPQQGGQVSFAAPAGGVPNALQQAQQAQPSQLAMMADRLAEERKRAILNEGTSGPPALRKSLANKILDDLLIQQAIDANKQEAPVDLSGLQQSISKNQILRSGGTDIVPSTDMQPSQTKEPVEVASKGTTLGATPSTTEVPVLDPELKTDLARFREIQTQSIAQAKDKSAWNSTMTDLTPEYKAKQQEIENLKNKWITGGKTGMPPNETSVKAPPGVEVNTRQKEVIPSGKEEKVQKQTEVLEKKPASIGSGIQAALKRNQEAGSINLGAVKALGDEAKLGFKNVKVAGQQLWNRLKNILPPSEVKVLEPTPGLKEFLQEKRTPQELKKWIEENGPKVEVRKFGVGEDISEDTRNLRDQNAQFHHWTDNVGASDYLRLQHTGKYDVVGNPPSVFAEELRGRTLEYNERIDKIHKAESKPKVDVAHWQSIAPKPESDMPGYVEIAVVKPLKEQTPEQKAVARAAGVSATSTGYNEPQFPSSHNFPPNTLGFVRGYMETMWKNKKTGELIRGTDNRAFDADNWDETKVFHVIEVQSDWAQNQRERQAHINESNPSNTTDSYRQAAKDAFTKGQDPLLPHYERLALKAAIDHAREQGADAIAISDAETAMMTEGHDRDVQDYFPPTKKNVAFAKTQIGKFPASDLYEETMQKLARGERADVPNEADLENTPELFKLDIERDSPRQSQGMRLHYDTTLQKIAGELTGSKGEKVSFGEHKMAFDAAPNNWGDDEMTASEPRKDLIFRNPDSTPKTDVSALMYPLEKAEKEFTYFGSDKPVKVESKVPSIGSGINKALEKNKGGETGAINIEPIKSAVEAVTNTFRWYTEPIVERLGRIGGAVGKKVSEEGQQIVSRAKEFYGKLTPTLDPAKKAVGKAFVGGTTWMRGIHKVTDNAATNNLFASNEGTIPVAKAAQQGIAKLNTANLEIGKLASVANPSFVPSGKLQRMLSAYGMDVVRRGSGPAWNAWTEGVARANGKSISQVQTFFRKWKATLDEPGPDIAALDKINQDFTREYPKTITHIKPGYAWHEVVVSDPFTYLEAAAQRTAHAAAFREVYKPGTGLLEATRKAVQKEIGTDRYETEFDKMMRALQGHPTDTYTSALSAPDTFTGSAGRLITQTIAAPIKALVLTGNAVTNLSETVVGGPAMFLGYRNVLPGVMKLPNGYAQLEMNGAVNKALQNYAFDPTSPLRSVMREFSNSLRAATFQQSLNELQEATAAMSAKVFADRVRNKTLTNYEKERFVSVARAMGITEKNARLALIGNNDIISQFERKAAAWLTSGNQAMAEKSSAGANRLFNELFWFHSYPQMTFNQVRSVMGNLIEDVNSGNKKQAWHNSVLLGRLMGGKFLQGALAVGIYLAFTQGKEGLKEKSHEIVNTPGEFVVDSYLASMGGPLYILKKTLESRGDSKALQDTLTQTVTPLGIGGDFLDATLGNGRYEGRDKADRIGMFVSSKTPGWRVVKAGMAMVGLSQDDLKLQAAKTGFYRWKKDTFGQGGSPDPAQSEGDAKFRVEMKKVVEAVENGKDWRAQLAGGEDKEKVLRSLLSRRMLVDNNGKELSDEQKESLRQRIGSEFVDKLEARDEMVKHVGYEFSGMREPPAGRAKRQHRER